jgi:polar amino acid transport system substrate-binding protein
MNIRNIILLSILIIVSGVVWYVMQKKPSYTIPNNVLIVGTNAEFPPFSFIEDNTIVGLDIDIAKEVAQRLHKTIELKNMSFDALIPALQLGSIHMIAAGMTPTPERAKRVLFTKPHMTGDTLVIVSLKENPFTSLDALKDKTIVVNQGYTADSFMSDKPVNLVRLSSALISDGLLALQSKRADAFVAAYSSVKPFFVTYGTATFMWSPIPNTQESDALAISPQYPELAQQIQHILDTMEADGALQQLKKKWKLTHD